MSDLFQNPIAHATLFTWVAFSLWYDALPATTREQASLALWHACQTALLVAAAGLAAAAKYLQVASDACPVPSESEATR